MRIRNHPGGSAGPSNKGRSTSRSEGVRRLVIVFAFILVICILGLLSLHRLKGEDLSSAPVSLAVPVQIPSGSRVTGPLSATTSDSSNPAIASSLSPIKPLSPKVASPAHKSATNKAVNTIVPIRSHAVAATVAAVEMIAPKKKSVAFAITITSDGMVVDGACVLLYSIVKAHMDSNLEISFVALVHPSVVEARDQLGRIGYRIIESETPVNTSAIRGKYLREHINDKAGCCGAKELIKLNAYRLTQFDWVVHVDVDVIILKSLEPLLNTFPTPAISMLYTTDPNMAPRMVVEKQPAQGGFLVLKPSYDDFQGFLDVIMEGDFRSGSAWGGSGIGWCWGGKTIQGVVPYYYNRITDKGRAIVLDRCYYNSMADTPNCTVQRVDELFSAHFTVCQKPWSCSPRKDVRLCMDLHARWFELRAEAESFYSHPQTTGDLCARGRKRFPNFNASQAVLPASFIARFNRVPLPAALKPYCSGGYTESSCTTES